MSKVLTGLNHFTFTYLDNVLIFSKSWEEHLQHLNTVFNRFKTAGLKIKLSKCQFFKTQLHYLGHKISADGLEPLAKQLEAIKNLAPTMNVDEAHQILGLLGYYRSFTPAFADKTTPITNLLKKKVPFVWSKQCQDVLDYLKYYSFPILTTIIYYIQMLLIMLIPVFYANCKVMTMILGQFHTFQEPLLHRTKVGVPLKKKHMPC